MVHCWAPVSRLRPTALVRPLTHTCGRTGRQTGRPKMPVPVAEGAEPVAVPPLPQRTRLERQPRTESPVTPSWTKPLTKQSVAWTVPAKLSWGRRTLAQLLAPAIIWVKSVMPARPVRQALGRTTRQVAVPVAALLVVVEVVVVRLDESELVPVEVPVIDEALLDEPALVLELSEDAEDELPEDVEAVLSVPVDVLWLLEEPLVVEAVTDDAVAVVLPVTVLLELEVRGAVKVGFTVRVEVTYWVQSAPAMGPTMT